MNKAQQLIEKIKSITEKLSGPFQSPNKGQLSKIIKDHKLTDAQEKAFVQFAFTNNTRVWIEDNKKLIVDTQKGTSLVDAISKKLGLKQQRGERDSLPDKSKPFGNVFIVDISKAKE